MTSKKAPPKIKFPGQFIISHQWLWLHCRWMFAAGLGLIVVACSDAPVEKRADVERDHVVATLPLPLASVHDRLARLAETRLRAVAKFADFRVVPTSSRAFPDDFQLQANAKNNVALQKYHTLDPKLRRMDFYLNSVIDDHWQSEYFVGNQPVPFKTAFILHLEMESEQETRIEVIEYLPTIWIGEKFVLLGHHGPDWYRDQRFVAPTTQDRLEILDLITKIVTG